MRQHDLSHELSRGGTADRCREPCTLWPFLSPLPPPARRPIFPHAVGRGLFGFCGSESNWATNCANMSGFSATAGILANSSTARRRSEASSGAEAAGGVSELMCHGENHNPAYASSRVASSRSASTSACGRTKPWPRTARRRHRAASRCLPSRSSNSAATDKTSLLASSRRRPMSDMSLRISERIAAETSRCLVLETATASGNPVTAKATGAPPSTQARSGSRPSRPARSSSSALSGVRNRRS